MNEYLVEDEYSVYEIDPDCIIGGNTQHKNYENVEKMDTCKRHGEKKNRSNTEDGCFCFLWWLILLKVSQCHSNS